MHKAADGRCIKFGAVDERNCEPYSGWMYLCCDFLGACLQEGLQVLLHITQGRLQKKGKGACCVSICIHNILQSCTDAELTCISASCCITSSGTSIAAEQRQQQCYLARIERTLKVREQTFLLQTFALRCCLAGRLSLACIGVKLRSTWWLCDEQLHNSRQCNTR